VSLKVVPKPACDPKAACVPKAGDSMNVHWKKSTNESKGKPEHKYAAAFGTSVRISKCCQRSKKLHIIFSLELGRVSI
jgi:hypothetical protein